MKHLIQIAIVGVLLLAVVSIAGAQEALQPVYRLGNFIEVGNDVFMHLIATVDARIVTVENRDFEKNTRDQVLSRNNNDTASQISDSDAAWFLNRLGVEARFQKNLEIYLLFEHRQFVDGSFSRNRKSHLGNGGRKS